MKTVSRLSFLICLLAVFIHPSAAAEGWKLNLNPSFGPGKKMLAVDKSRQKFHLLAFDGSEQNPVFMSMDCATGQTPGDKIREGDLKTPEGVYFLTNTLSQGLDYELYGSMAYTLNFPNPVDRLRGKTGHGIWIHGRGEPIEPMETKGCVALNNNDILQLESVVSLGLTPAIIAESIEIEDHPSSQDLCSALIERTRQWAGAWSRKSNEFFSYYDQIKFAASQESSWAQFESNKKFLFQHYPWINVLIKDVTCLPGPDYVVTFFLQRFESPTFSSQGVKRLYWEKNREGQWLIVGSEFIPADLDIGPEPAQHLVDEMTPWIESWRKSWLAGELEPYLAKYHDRAVRGDLVGKKALARHWRSIWEDGDTPAEVHIDRVHVAVSGRERIVDFRQVYRSHSGYTDTGTKTLRLVPDPAGQGWLILQETWEQRENG